jgi:tetratricopeptide (TPR) repeat protein
VGIAGLLVRYVWLFSLGPLDAGDWKWPTRGRLLEWFPWPSVWNDTLGLSGENRFLDAFRFPVYAVDGFIASLGGTWSVVERLVYMLPFAVLLPVGGWLLAREVLGSTRWTLLAPVLLMGNTYFLINGDGEVPLVLSEAIGCVVLVLFLRSMHRFSLRWALAAGLLLAVGSASDLRPAFLTVLLMVGYLVIIAVAEPTWRMIRLRILLISVTGLTFLGTQFFWLVPLLTYKGHAALPIPRAPDFTIITFEHGIAGVAAGWTGGTPAAFSEAPLDPLFMILPLVAMFPLAWRKMRPEILWLALAALVGAFLAKTNNPPIGGLYDWIYLHVPGFSLFREGSKFFYPISLGYAVLIPASFESLTELTRGLTPRIKRVVRPAVGIAIALTLFAAGSCLLILERGQLGSTTSTISEPAVFKQINRMINQDKGTGPVLWFGTPVYVTGAQYQDDHTFTITSATHPLDNLTGDVTGTVVQSRDNLQYFCPVITAAYCYVTPTVFPYLVDMVGASYIISPVGPNVGVLPHGVTRGWLRQQLTSMFGAPIVVGQTKTQFLVWHLTQTRPSITNYPAVVLVNSGPWSLRGVLPALQSMGVPAAYRQSFDTADYPVARANLPDTVGVSELVNGSCAMASAGPAAIMAQSYAGVITATIDGSATTLQQVARSSRDPAWAAYGPVPLPSGNSTVSATGGLTLGPCLAWTPLAAAAFGNHSDPAGPTKSSANGEQLRAPVSGATGPWTELRRNYDPGWRLRQKVPTAVADGLFNLYHTDTAINPTKGFVFTFSTLKWEKLGRIMALLTLLVALLGLWGLRGRQRNRPVSQIREIRFESRAASVMGLIGTGFMALAGLAVASDWFGVPSRFPLIGFNSDPYNFDIECLTAAVGFLGLSLVYRLVVHLRRGRSAHAAGRPTRAARGWNRLARALGASLVLATVASGCGLTRQGADQALSGAQQAGTLSRLVEGATLQEAQISLQANNPGRCIRDYTKALKVFTTLASAYAGRAQCYQSNGLDDEAAVRDYTRALALSPGNPLYLLERATADQGQGGLRQGAADYLAAAASPSASAAEELTAVDGLIGMNQDARAIRALQVAESRFPSEPDVLIAASDVAVATGDDGRAATLLAQAAQLAKVQGNQGAGVSVLSHTCGFYVNQLEYLQALNVCQQAAQQAEAIGGDPSGAYDNLSAADLSLGNLTAAANDMTSAIGAFQGNVSPNAQPAGVDGFGLAYLYEAQGRLLVQLHEPAAAIKAYQMAKASLPKGLPDFAARLKSDINAARHD